VNLKAFLEKSARWQSSPLYTINNFCFAFSFILTRVCYSPFIWRTCFKHWNDFKALKDKSVIPSLFVLNGLVDVMNVYWLKFIVARIWAMLYPSASASASIPTAQT